MRKWLARAGKEYARRKAAAMKRVVRWEYATKEERSVEPLYFERNPKLGRGKRVAKLPSPAKYGNMAYGLDDAGRCVVERKYVRNGAYQQRFLVWTDDSLEWVLYSDTRQAQNVCRAVRVGGHITSYESSGLGGSWSKSFDYLPDGRVRIVEHYENPNGTPGGRTEVVVTPRGKLEEPRVEDLFPAVEKCLLAEIPKRIRALKLKTPVYCLIVSFPGRGNDLFPPLIGLGLASDRDDFVARKLPLTEVLWDPSDWELYGNPPLDDLSPTCAALNLAISRRDAWKQGYAAYDRIAAALRELDWKRLLHTTSDFVVFAVDHDNTQLWKHLRDAAGARTYAAWKKQGWVR